ncbi:MAG: ParB/RepB/Spo0J family partition protein [Candidatus Bathyarchaeia archaeon]
MSETIAIAKIRVPPYHIRESYEKIPELAESLSRLKVYPIIVRPIPRTDEYELVAGARRLKAYGLLGLKELKVGSEVIVREYSDADALVVSAIENLQRQELDNYEKGRWVQLMMTKYGWTQDQLAKETGIPRSTLRDWLTAWEGLLLIRKAEEERRREIEQFAEKPPMAAAAIGRLEGVPFETVSKAVLKAREKAPEIIQVAKQLELTREESRELFRRLEKQPERPVREIAEEVRGSLIMLRLPFPLLEKIRAKAEADDLTIEDEIIRLLERAVSEWQP